MHRLRADKGAKKGIKYTLSKFDFVSIKTSNQRSNLSKPHGSVFEMKASTTPLPDLSIYMYTMRFLAGVCVLTFDSLSFTPAATSLN